VLQSVPYERIAGADFVVSGQPARRHGHVWRLQRQSVRRSTDPIADLHPWDEHGRIVHERQRLSIITLRRADGGLQLWNVGRDTVCEQRRLRRRVLLSVSRNLVTVTAAVIGRPDHRSTFT